MNMNKLRKPPPTSHTMRAALASMSTTSISIPASTAKSASVWKSTTTQVQPNRERYWASRALVAETMLAAQASHQAEIQGVSYREEARRMRELAAAAQASEARHAIMQRTIFLLVGCVAILVSVIIYLAIYTHHNGKRQNSWVALPSHFTIPILSPFTSVTEQESSVVNSRTVAMIILASTCLVYFMFRHWLHRRTAAL